MKLALSLSLVSNDLFGHRAINLRYRGRCSRVCRGVKSVRLTPFLDIVRIQCEVTATASAVVVVVIVVIVVIVIITGQRDVQCAGRGQQDQEEVLVEHIDGWTSKRKKDLKANFQDKAGVFHKKRYRHSVLAVVKRRTSKKFRLAEYCK